MKFLFLLFLFASATGQIAFAQTSPAAADAAPTPPNLSRPQGKVSAPDGPIDIKNEPIVRAVAQVQPAVVNITAQGTSQTYTVVDPFFTPFRGTRRSQSIGSGLIVSADGYVVTNAHVVGMADREKPVSITLISGSKYAAKIVESDEDADLALLKITDTTQQFPYFDLGYTSPNLLGESVIALGSPEGYQNSVSSGILSAKNRTFTVEGHTYKSLIQTDAAINPGNSGGPLIDLNGGLVGINSAKLAGTAIENIGFAIPHEVVVAWAREALAVARGEKPPPVSAATTALDALRDRFGLTVKPLGEADAQGLDLEIDGGLLITKVEPGSPAAAAGLHKNMIVVAIGNRPIVDEKSLPRELLTVRKGGRVRLHIIVAQQFMGLTVQRGGSVMLTAN